MANYLAIIPEIGLVALAFIILLVDLRISKERKSILPWLTFAGLAVILALTVVFGRPDGAELVWGGMLRHDLISFVFRLLFLFGAGATALFAIGWESIGKRGERLGLKLYGATTSGGIVVIDVRKSDILRDHPSRN